MNTLIFLQHYWWVIISLLGALLIFMFFVQGVQGMLYEVGRTPEERDIVVGVIGHKWELTFTVLVTFGGAFFASFPLFYSTSFGGATYVWTAILLAFVIQAVAFEFRRKPGNLLGDKTYEWFLMINGFAGPLLLGMAFATLFTGAPFTVDRMNLLEAGGDTVISRWATPWHGLDAVADVRNWMLGIIVLSLSRVLAMHYLLATLNDSEMRERARERSGLNAVPCIVLLPVFVGAVCCLTGASYGDGVDIIAYEHYRYFNTFVEMPWFIPLLLGGVGLLVYGCFTGWWNGNRRALWFSGAGTVLTFFTLILLSGWNHACYYVSTVDMQSSLNIANSSSSEFTLKVMAWVSLFIPFVVAYIWYVWRALFRRVETPGDTKRMNIIDFFNSVKF
ncbi:MAG: cytochrome d ubiquinol oxidase subunit II [Alistipes sp.]|nr:cytochrome d ubiquinol oxidase subunit II [Alistipes sp.]